MNLDFGRDRNARPRTRNPLFRGKVRIAMVALAAILVLLNCEKDRPNYYAPARAPLTDAAMILSGTYNEEAQLLQKLGKVHHQLDQAIGLLHQAERLDPADRRQIQAMEDRLSELENQNPTRANNPQALASSYNALTKELTALATKLEQPRPQGSE